MNIENLIPVMVFGGMFMTLGCLVLAVKLGNPSDWTRNKWDWVADTVGLASSIVFAVGILLAILDGLGVL